MIDRKQHCVMLKHNLWPLPSTTYRKKRRIFLAWFESVPCGVADATLVRTMPLFWVSNLVNYTFFIPQRLSIVPEINFRTPFFGNRKTLVFPKISAFREFFPVAFPERNARFSLLESPDPSFSRELRGFSSRILSKQFPDHRCRGRIFWASNFKNVTFF
jgi:hypothetical protein